MASASQLCPVRDARRRSPARERIETKAARVVHKGAETRPRSQSYFRYDIIFRISHYHLSHESLKKAPNAIKSKFRKLNAILSEPVSKTLEAYRYNTELHQRRSIIKSSSHDICTPRFRDFLA